MNQVPEVQSSPLKQFVSESLPTAALAHSYLVELRWDPTIGKNQPLEEFTDNLLHELHHHAALWGALLRLERGDPWGGPALG